MQKLIQAITTWRMTGCRQANGAAELEAQKFRLGEKWSGGLGYGRIRNVVAFWPPKVENVLNPHSLR